VPAGAECHAGESRWKEISYQDFGAKESAGFFDHVVRKRRRSCPVDLAVSHPADGRCGLWTAISSSKPHVAQGAGYIRKNDNQKAITIIDARKRNGKIW
jgi:hypothetical protein